MLLPTVCLHHNMENIRIGHHAFDPLCARTLPGKENVFARMTIIAPDVFETKAFHLVGWKALLTIRNQRLVLFAVTNTEIVRVIRGK